MEEEAKVGDDEFIIIIIINSFSCAISIFWREKVKGLTLFCAFFFLHRPTGEICSRVVCFRVPTALTIDQTTDGQDDKSTYIYIYIYT